MYETCCCGTEMIGIVENNGMPTNVGFCPHCDRPCNIGMRGCPLCKALTINRHGGMPY